MRIPYETHAPKIISFYDLKAAGREHQGRCPNCGGNDRFRLQNYNGEVRHHCRKGCQLAARTDAMRRDGVIPQVRQFDKVPYHDQKGVPLSGAELRGSDVFVPICDIVTGDQVGGQTITPTGKKFFTNGMKKTGAGAFIGVPTDRIYVTEGWADAVVVHQATGCQVLFALDAGSLPKAVLALRQRCPFAEIVVVADHDDEGLKAARATNAPYCTPSQPGMDAWDVWNTGGDEAVATMLEAIIDGKADDHQSVLEGYAVVAGDELSKMDFPPVEFLIQGLLPTPTLALLVGPPKGGKSWLAWRWALAVAAQRLGVFFIASEDNQRRIKDRLTALHATMPANLHLLAAHNSTKPIPRGSEAIGFLRSIKAQHPDISLFIVDIAQSIMELTARDKDYAGASAEWSALQRLAHELKVAILLVHHTRKSFGLACNSPLESVLGSTAIAATAETLMIMEPIIGTRDVKLHVTGKDVETVDLVFPWNNPGFGDPMDADEASLGEAQKAVLDYIRQNPGCTQSTIAVDLKKDPGQVSKIMMRLRSGGMVSKSEKNGLFPV